MIWESQPTEEGWYWYKDDEPPDDIIIVFYSKDMGWIQACGNDIPWYQEVEGKIIPPEGQYFGPILPPDFP